MVMELRPIMASMSRNKFGAILIAVQMAVTLAILVNSWTLIDERLARSARPTGVKEADLFALMTEPLEDAKDARSREFADVDALRSLDGVVDAYITNDWPLAGGGWSNSVNLTREQRTPTANTAYYFGDEHALNTLGLNLVAGRNFTHDEVVDRTGTEDVSVSGVIITKPLADKLFPGGSALGKALYIESDTKSSTVIGVVERLESPFTGTGKDMRYAEYSTIAPYRPIDNFTNYMVRAQPGQLARAMKSAEAKLDELDGNRLIRAKSMFQVRSEAYEGDHGLVVLLTAVCTALLVVTAFGIIGLTSYWVSQRRRQIGIRRALGATRRAILQYYQMENLLIATAGALGGITCAIALNLWMVRSFEVARMHNGLAVAGGLIMLLLGQVAVLYPAVRAASIPPALATRGG